MKKSLLFVAVFVSNFAQAYHQNQGRICWTYELHKQHMVTDPTYRKNQQNLETFTAKYAAQKAMRTGVATIPVVVHVLYSTSEENISDAQIASQIKSLNEDYRKLNVDVAKVPDVFKPLAADARLQFALACRDPNGNATTGITRTHTNKTSFTGNDDQYIKYTAGGGHDAWPATDYLNIWIVNFSGGLLGYAQFPGGDAATDGVVLGYNTVGNQGAATAPFNLGRTATHEVGHWLNLQHIWGDDEEAADTCSGTDEVSDTPNQAISNSGTPDFPTISCNNGPNGDMFMNYMDYVDDAAMFMFSTGQSTRIDAALTADSTRAAVLQSTAASCSIVEEFNGSTTTGSSYGLSYEVTPKGLGARFVRTAESRVQFPFASGLPKSGTIEMLVKVESAYGYNNYTLNANQDCALLFTTDIQGGDVTWPGSTWFYACKNGDVGITISTSKYGSTPSHQLVSTGTAFRFGQWHSLGFSYGNIGQALMVDGIQVAKAQANTTPMGSGGNHSSPVDIPTLGEAVPGFWNNNQYDGGFEGVVDTFRASTGASDWTLISYTVVTPSVIGAGGNITPNTAQTIASGATASFTLTPASGYIYLRKAGGTCPAGTWNSNVYTTGAITADCTVDFKFFCTACLPNRSGWRSLLVP